MIKTGILNPHLNALLSRVRHTNTLILADRGFPFFPMIETVDLSLVDDIPTVTDVLRAIQQNFTVGHFYIAEEFRQQNAPEVLARLARLTAKTPITWESHRDLKLRVPAAIGLVRTGDTTQYANIILESA